MKTSFKNLSEFKEQIAQSAEYRDMIKENPEEFLNSITFDSPIRVPWVFAIIAGLMGLIGLSCIIFIGLSAIDDPHQLIQTINGANENTIIQTKVPEVLGTVAISIITAIAGLLAPSPLNDNQ